MGAGGSMRTVPAMPHGEWFDAQKRHLFGGPDLLERHPSYFQDIERYLENGEIPDYAKDDSGPRWAIGRRFRRHADRAKAVGIDVLKAEV